MSAEPILRDLRPTDDAETLVAIALAAWRPLHDHLRGKLGPEIYAIVHPDWRKSKAEQIRAACAGRQDAHVCVADLDGEIVGFVSFYANVRPQVGEIGNNAVHPDYQSRGIATQLYRLAFERLRAAGMRFVRVQTGLDPIHAPARRAYEKAGFDVSGHESVEYFRKL